MRAFSTGFPLVIFEAVLRTNFIGCETEALGASIFISEQIVGVTEDMLDMKHS
jgi:hypothetical protein